MPRFDSKTWWGIRITITGGTNAISATDVAITSTNRANTTGGTIASDLQVRLRAAIDAASGESDANATVVFNTSGSSLWKFTINSVDGTDIAIESPERDDLTDATEVLFAKTGSSGAQTWVSNLPQDTFIETDLPSDFLAITDVEWDGQPLAAGPWALFISPDNHGDPTHYATKNNKIRLFPAPSSQKMFHIWYKGTETDLAVNGSADGTDCPLPSEVHMAPAFYATAMLLEEKHEYDKSTRHMGNFVRMAREYRLRESNADWAMFPDPETAYRPPKVISSA